MRKFVYYTFLALLILNCVFLLITLPFIFSSSENALSWICDFLFTLFVGFPGTFRIINKYKTSDESQAKKTRNEVGSSPVSPEQTENLYPKSPPRTGD